MCVIAVSSRGKRQPAEEELRQMWLHNPHGAGYMYARNGLVRFEKGFMTWKDFIRAVRLERFTAADSVAYHFRIATQGGICPEMTHPFPLSPSLADHEMICGTCKIGIMHNGIIGLTTDHTQKRFSDTSLFVARYLTKIINAPEDLESPELLDIVYMCAKSKLAIMRGDGYIATVGTFYNRNGVLVSNEFYIPTPAYSTVFETKVLRD